MNTANLIENKVIVITGSGSGLGAATALHLAARGAKLVVSGPRAESLDGVVDQIKKAHGQAIAVVADVTRRADLDALIKKTVSQFGRVDVLINNAGIMPLAPLDKLMVDEWDRMIDVNIRGVLYGIAAVLPVMRSQRSGHIINLASVAGLKLFTPIGTVYSATKFAVRAISEGLRVEAPDGVRTTIISPGAIESGLQLGSTDPDSVAGVKAFYQENQISADAIARAIAYAIEQPADVDVNEIVLRPTVQEF
jgi:NADP-dependent 3-hydroxy acid dehydrogenase YdfG